MKSILIATLMTAVSFAAQAEFHTILGSDRGWANRDLEVTHRYVDNNNKPTIQLVKDHSDNSYHIEVDRDIDNGLTEMLTNYLEEVSSINKYATVVYLNSGGGYLSSGITIGDLFNKHNVKAIVTGGQVCASSCAIMFIGARYSYIKSNGIVSTHAPYIKNKYGSTNCMVTGTDRSKSIEEYINAHLSTDAAERFTTEMFDQCNTKSLVQYTSTDHWMQQNSASKAAVKAEAAKVVADAKAAKAEKIRLAKYRKEYLERQKALEIKEKKAREIRLANVKKAADARKAKFAAVPSGFNSIGSCFLKSKHTSGDQVSYKDAGSIVFYMNNTKVLKDIQFRIISSKHNNLYKAGSSDIVHQELGLLSILNLGAPIYKSGSVSISASILNDKYSIEYKGQNFVTNYCTIETK